MDKDEQIKKLQQENKWLLAGVKWLKRDRETLLSLVDGAQPVVELFENDAPYHAVWKKNWLILANSFLRKDAGK